MTTKNTSTSSKAIKKSAFEILIDNDKTQDRQFAEICISSATLNAVTARKFTQPLMGESSLSETIAVMSEMIVKVNSGNLNDLEGTLTAQSVTLNALFIQMTSLATSVEKVSNQEIYMRLALKAQAQCARTIEVIASMKSPQVIFAKQANISHGHQQVNNEISQPKISTRAEKTIMNQNELLSEGNNAKMDTSRTATASGTDKAMATMEE